MAERRPIPTRSEVSDKHAKWDRIEALLAHDEDKFKEEPFNEKLPNETTVAYDARKVHFATGFINPSVSLVTAAASAIFQQRVKMEFDDGDTSMLATFAENCTMGNDPMPFKRYVKDHVASALRAYGTTFTVVDKPQGEALNRLQERNAGMPYLCNIRPQDVLNYEFLNGELMWFAYKATHRPLWEDPIDNPGEPESKDVERIWTRTQYVSRDIQDGTIYESVDHGWGIVPVVIQATFLPKPTNVLGVSAFEQSSNMLIKFNNCLGVAVYELAKHGNSTLLMPEEAITASNQTTDGDGNTEMKKQDKGTVLTYVGEKPPEYLVKDLEGIEHGMNLARYYLAQAFENERDMRSVSKKSSSGSEEMIEQSGLAKLVDRDPIEANLVSLAEDCELYAQKVYDIVATMLRTKNDAVFEFDKDFDLRAFKQKLEEIKMAAEAGMKKMTPTGYKELHKNLVPDITDDSDTQKAMIAEIDDAEVEEDDTFLDKMLEQEEKGGPPAPGGGKPPPFGKKQQEPPPKGATE